MSQSDNDMIHRYSYWSRAWSFHDRENDPETESEGEEASPMDNLSANEGEVNNTSISENCNLSNTDPSTDDEVDLPVDSIEEDPPVPPAGVQLPPGEVVQAPESPAQLGSVHLDQELQYFGDNTNLTEMLRCPVCYDIMLPPIALCMEGHSICHSCKTRLEDCPICRKFFLETRNRIAENLANMCIIQCKFKNYGCNVKLRGDELAVHQQECEFRAVMEAEEAVRRAEDGNDDDDPDNIRSLMNDMSDFIVARVLLALNQHIP